MNPGLANQLLAQLRSLASAAWGTMLSRILSLAGKRWCDLLVMSALCKAWGKEAASVPQLADSFCPLFPSHLQNRCHCKDASNLARIPRGSADPQIPVPSEACQHTSAPSPLPQAGSPTQWQVPGFQLHPHTQTLPCQWTPSLMGANTSLYQLHTAFLNFTISL